MSLYDINGKIISNVEETKPYTGKKWAVLGDSISMSYATNLYHTIIANNLGFTVQNLAVSGKGYEYVRDTELPLIDEDVDLITIMCGTNDMVSQSNVGEATDTADSGTFSGTVYSTILAIQEKFPNVPLGIITPVNRVDDESYHNWVIKISKGIKAVCEQHSVSCFDLNSCSGVLGLTEDNIAYYYNDTGCHPNDAGHAVIASKLEPFIKSLMPI